MTPRLVQDPLNTIEARVRADGFGDATPILFYSHHDPYGWMSNFSRHSIWLPNPFTGQMTLYRTGEHRYQAMKAVDIGDHLYVIESNGPGEAKSRGREIRLRSGWGDSYGDLCWYVMLETILAKVHQSVGMPILLNETERRPIYEDSPTDDIWGVRYRKDYRGKNLLGRCWMTVRNVVIRKDFP